MRHKIVIAPLFKFKLLVVDSILSLCGHIIASTIRSSFLARTSWYCSTTNNL